jgi:hypothetical protein
MSDGQDAPIMTQDQITPASMYCRQCGYQLTGLSENRCP